ncbi:MAG: twin-arginine translocation signal domain-containing protein [Thermoguttaceae bacterium]
MTDRREFLKRIALLGAAALPARSLWAQTAVAQSTVVQAVAKDAGLFTVSHGKAILPQRTPRTIAIPDVGEYKVLKGDFHIHTLFSDGLVMPKDRVYEAVDNGLDVIAITDHIEYRPNLGGNSIKLVDDNHNIAYNIARPGAEKNNLLLVRGTEITKKIMPPGHFNALFIEDANPIAAVVDDWRNMLAVAADQGAFVHWNHPGWVAPKSGGLAEGVPMSFTDEHEQARAKGHIHGVEVFNGTSYYPVALDWCNERNITPIANSDIHKSEWNMYGHHNLLRPMTLILAKERSVASVREAFFAQRTIGFAAGMIFGRAPWVEELFRAAVKIASTPDRITLNNVSDIPCEIEANGQTHSIPPKGTLEIARSNTLKKLVVSNWLVGTHRPLEIDVDAQLVSRLSLETQTRW